MKSGGETIARRSRRDKAEAGTPAPAGCMRRCGSRRSSTAHPPPPRAVKITAIEPQKNHAERVNVHVDGEFRLALALMAMLLMLSPLGFEILMLAPRVATTGEGSGGRKDMSALAEASAMVFSLGLIYKFAASLFSKQRH